MNNEKGTALSETILVLLLFVGLTVGAIKIHFAARTRFQKILQYRNSHLEKTQHSLRPSDFLFNDR